MLALSRMPIHKVHGQLPGAWGGQDGAVGRQVRRRPLWCVYGLGPALPIPLLPGGPHRQWPQLWDTAPALPADRGHSRGPACRQSLVPGCCQLPGRIPQGKGPIQPLAPWEQCVCVHAGTCVSRVHHTCCMSTEDRSSPAESPSRHVRLTTLGCYTEAGLPAGCLRVLSDL